MKVDCVVEIKRRQQREDVGLDGDDQQFEFPSFEDWKAGRMKLPDLDNGEFIPLPPRIGELREPEPMS